MKANPPNPSPHPHLTAPQNTADRAAWLQLIRSHRVGPSSFYRLTAEYGSVAGALSALPDVARNSGVKKYEPCSFAAANLELEQGTQAGFRALCCADPDYPNFLRHTPDAPPVIWALGDTTLGLQPRIVALVGARNSSSIGTRMTRLLAKELGAAGIVIVSGLARGIDAAAHQAALHSGTIAVQAGGLDVVYPRENELLHREIAESGLRLSEQPLGLTPQARHFPQRNRIIAGLACATIVIEGAARSGSLITARDAADLGREVMAVPGNPLDARAAGCNLLIRDGATLVRSGQDVIDALDALGPQTDPAPDPIQPSLPLQPTDQVASKILSLLGPTAVQEDILIRDMGLPAQHISQHLIALELSGKIARFPGGMLALSA